MFENAELQRPYIIYDPGAVGDFPGLEYDVAVRLLHECEQWHVQPFHPGLDFERDGWPLPRPECLPCS